MASRLKQSNLTSISATQKKVQEKSLEEQVYEMATNVPHVSKPVAGVCVLFNLIFPGFGTLIAACAASDNVSKTQMTIALMQFLTAVFLIGFFWA